MNYDFAPTALKKINSLDKPIAKRIVKKVDYLFSLKDPLSKSVKLQGYSNMYRFRIGDYRVIFTVSTSLNNASVLVISHRKDVYKNI